MNKEPEKKLIEGEDYYFNEEGFMVLTAKYLLERGHCCNNGCRHCPYKKGGGQGKQDISI